MKKLFAIVALVFSMATASFAQQTPAEKATAAKKEMKAAHTKADGTADMRYKENKGKVKNAADSVKRKAAGTKDMRFKENKEKSNMVVDSAKRKADGTKDMRFKENKDKAKQTLKKAA